MRAIGTASLVIVTSLGLGCSALPDSAAPKGGVVAASELDDSDVIPYRALTRADFRGTSVPGPFAAVADRVGAATCGQVRTTDDTQIFVQGVTPPGGETRYFAKVKRLRFRALMDRSCSWWNDKVAAFAPDYVLEHEQIHFALYELGARKLNEQVEDLVEDVENEGSDVESVQAHAEGAINGALEDAVGEILDQNREFDEDTSLGYQPARQKEWLSRVTARLAETERWASRERRPHTDSTPPVVGPEDGRTGVLSVMVGSRVACGSVSHARTSR
jgi:hypothetical protein